MTCNQSVGLVARRLEEEGIATICLMTRTDLAQITKAPRTLVVKFPYGAPFGAPGNLDQRRAVILAAINLLANATQAGEIVESDIRWK